jgi:hypothetical protein
MSYNQTPLNFEDVKQASLEARAISGACARRPMLALLN